MPNISQSSLITQLQTIINGLSVTSETKERLITLAKSAQMIGANASTITTQLQTLISTLPPSSALNDVALLVVSLALITDNRVLTVPAIVDLPSTAAAGSVYFVESEGYPYIRRINGTWVMIETNSQGAASYPTALTWGNNTDGRLGDNTTTSKSSPVFVSGGFTDWTQISAGGYATIAVRANGTAWAWGSNANGQLGMGTASTSRLSPVSVVGGFTDWVQVSAGQNHGLGLRSNGTVWSWGQNGQGQIGDGLSDPISIRSSPVSVVGGFTDWVQVTTGSSAFHSIGLRANGTLWGWGRNTNGQLGDNTNISKSSPVSVVGGFTDWVQVSAGGAHSIGVRANGTAWAWGLGSSGRLGDGTSSSSNTLSPVSVVGGFTDWVQVSAGGAHSIGVRANGTAWAWGYNGSGQLGTNNTTGTSSPVSVVGGFMDWVQLDAGLSHNIGVRSNGTAWAWGTNIYGQLGDNTSVSKSSPVSVVGGFTDWVQVSAGSIHTAALRS